MLYWVLKYIFIGPILKLLYRPKIKGRANLPKSGPYILAVNHNSFLDSFFVPLAVGPKVTYLAKDEYFVTPGIKGFFMKMFFSGVGQVPINRAGGSASEAALKTGVRILTEGNVLGIYPEGTRSPDGRLYRGHTGVARMAIETNVPVIPCGVKGTREIQPPGTKIPRIKRYSIEFGEPIDFSRYEGQESDRFVLRSATDEIMYEIMQISGQEYTDEYAKRPSQRASSDDGTEASSNLDK
ncbi:MAG: lysophospholipid acyltransferase family protein [Candidatus Nanopelagicales bacterium]